MGPDADQPTVHVRCGSDIFAKLREAGFEGEMLEFSDPVCMGPVPEGADLVAVRARFIEAAFGVEDALTRLRKEIAALEAARASGARIVLWCEHDGYDQLVLARVLDALAERPGVELICVAEHAGPARFVGLGQLTAAELLALWPGRVAVEAGPYALGAAVWAALRRASPEGLQAIVDAGTPAVPAMAGAVLRHLQELPWVEDGLSLTERLVLRAVSQRAGVAGRVFGAVQAGDPLPFMGDTMVWAVIRDLAEAREPALRVGAGAAWAEREVALTPLGERLLAGQADWQAQGPGERWVGGVRVPSWRWDGGLVRCSV